MIKKILFALVALLALLLKPALAQELILYSPNTVQKIELLQSELKKQLGIQFGTVTGSTGVLMRRIEAEHKRPKGDFVWSTTANTIAPYAQYLEHYEPAALSAVPKNLHMSDKNLIPVHLQLVAVMVNSDDLGALPMPTKWADFANPIYKGKVIVTDPASSSTGYSALWGLSKVLDKETFAQVVGNLVLSSSSQAVPRAVAMGEYPIGIIFEFSAYEYIAGGQEEIKLVYPQEGTFIAPDYAALIKGGAHLENAKKAIDTLLSQEAQALFLKEVYMRPVRSDVKVSQYLDLPDFDDIAIFPVNEQEAFAGRDAFLKAFAALPKAR